jgi:hypothetical protein
MKLSSFLIQFLIFGILISACSEPKEKKEPESVKSSTADIRAQVDTLLNNFHETAAQADFENYFNCFAEDGVFMGTDATENWNKSEFMVWSKPFFDRGKAWDFSVLERNVFVSNNGEVVWFDELLDTQMKICRGSGVAIQENGSWKIAQYVLSMTIPNSVSNKVIPIKAAEEDNLISEYRKQKPIR